MELVTQNSTEILQPNPMIKSYDDVSISNFE